MPPFQPQVLVIGAGVTGLTTAVLLAESGLRVLVRGREMPPQTTSAAAGAMWGPVLAADDRVGRWARESRLTLESLASNGDSGVRLMAGLEAARTPIAPPEWVADLDSFRVARHAELPDGFVVGWRYAVPVIDMPRYLSYLLARLGAGGGRIEVGQVRALPEAAAEAPVVINCTGIGARELVPDDQVVPIRGQLVVVDNPGVDSFFAEATAEDCVELTYFLPHGDHVVLGSTAEAGRWDARADLRMAEAIIRRCAAIEPSLGRAAVRAYRVGLRPGRPRVRLEHVEVDHRHVIHNYGHGGGGVSVSWACAREVVGMVAAIGVS